MIFIAMPAYARPAERRVIVVAVEQSTIDAWRATPALARVLDDGASAVLIARTAREESGSDARVAAAFATLGAGARMHAGNEGRALAEAVVPLGVPFLVSRDLQRVLAAPPVHVLSDAVPGDLAVPSVAVLDARADVSIVERARALLRPRDAMIVLSLVPAQPGIRLGVVGMLGEGRGVLSSISTRRDGVVALADIAPTVLGILGIDRPDSMEGRALSVVRATPRVTSDEANLRWAARARGPVTRALMLGAIGVALLLGAFAARGRWSHALDIATLAVVASPGAALMLHLVAGRGTPTAAVLWLFGIASTIAVASVLALGPPRALAVVAAATAVAIGVDLVLGGPLASRSPLSYVIARGDRFYGIGNEYMGVMIAAVLIVLATWFERAQPFARTSSLVAIAAVVAGSIAVMASPSYGAKLGATLVAVPAFGALIVRSRNIGWRLGVIAFLGLTTVVATGLVYAAGRTSGTTHIGRAPTGAVASRKLDAVRGLLRFSLWTDALLVILAVVVLVYVARRAQVRATLHARPALAALVHAGVVAVVCSVAFNDAGLVAAALLTAMLAPPLLAAFAGASEPPPANRSAPRPPSPLAASS